VERGDWVFFRAGCVENPLPAASLEQAAARRHPLENPMLRQIFVNLPVKNLARSQAFFKALGLGFNARFTNEQGACLQIAENIYAMLLVEPFFQGFTTLPVADATKATEVLIALSADSRNEVDLLVSKAVSAGATTPNAPQDHGFMYQHGFADLDGHQWEVFWMDEAAAPAQM
jgi:predicted lactoylglutathione lyase